MKFQFCGNLSCPEWFLAECVLLTKITAIKLKLVTNHLVQRLLDDIDNSDKILSLLENSGFISEEINSIIACLEFIISNSCCYDITDDILIKELIDIGLPKENVEQIGKIFKSNKDKLRIKQSKLILRISQLKEFNYSVSKFIVSNEKSVMEGEEISQDASNKFADVKLKYITYPNSQKPARKEAGFIVFPDKLNELIHSLEKAQQIMNKY